MVKLKKQGCPMDSVAAAQAWRQERQNIAARKPLPGASVNQALADPLPQAPPPIVAREVREDGFDLDESHDAARTRREIAEANLAELKEGELSRELVRRVDVDRAAFEAARALRDGLTNCAKRLGATVAVLSTPEECAAAIEREHRTLLQSWSRTMGAHQAPPAP